MPRGRRNDVHVLVRRVGRTVGQRSVQLDVQHAHKRTALHHRRVLHEHRLQDVDRRPPLGRHLELFSDHSVRFRVVRRRAEQAARAGRLAGVLGLVHDGVVRHVLREHNVYRGLCPGVRRRRNTVGGPRRFHQQLPEERCQFVFIRIGRHVQRALQRVLLRRSAGRYICIVFQLSVRGYHGNTLFCALLSVEYRLYRFRIDWTRSRSSFLGRW